MSEGSGRREGEGGGGWDCGRGAKLEPCPVPSFRECDQVLKGNCCC